MAVLYISKQGAILRHNDKKLIVEYKNEKLSQIPVLYVDSILIFGNVQVTGQTFALLLESGVDVSFLSFRGKLRGTLGSTKSKNVYLRLAQFDKFRDKGFRVKIVREIVKAKLSNQLTVITKYKYIYPELKLSNEISTMENMISQVDNRNEIEELMGLEGAGSAAYFKFFAKIMRGDFIFEGRKHYPSRDPVNAMLSLGYVMLTNEIASLLESHSFDPYIGVFHGIRYGRESLPLDIVEEFRQPLIDLFTLKLINRRVFTKADFTSHNDGSCYFIEESLKAYFNKYDDMMNETVKDRFGEEKSWRDFLKRQVERLVCATIREGEYQAFLF